MDRTHRANAREVSCMKVTSVQLSAIEESYKITKPYPANALTIDLEDWFHVTNFEKRIDRSRWDYYPSRIPYTVPRLHDLLAEYEVHATFFVLGCVARKFPSLIRRIGQAGHEIASHGDAHRLLTNQTADEFKEQLIVSRDVIEQAAGNKIYGHRAPSYSFRKSTDWAIDILLECGFQYDSSIFPFGSRLDPKLCEQRFPCYLVNSKREKLTEYPLSTMRIFGINIPIAGGGYFRLLPYGFTHWSIAKINQKGFPAITYFHPWEIDPRQPRVEIAGCLSKFRHYYGLDKTESKLRKLISEFRFDSIRNIFWSPHTERYELFPRSPSTPRHRKSEVGNRNEVGHNSLVNE